MKFLPDVFQVAELQMGFQHVASQPSRASFYATFLKDSRRGKDLGTTTCLKTVVGVGKDMLRVQYFHSAKSYFCVSLIFFHIIRHIMRLCLNLATLWI